MANLARDEILACAKAGRLEDIEACIALALPAEPSERELAWLRYRNRRAEGASLSRAQRLMSALDRTLPAAARAGQLDVVERLLDVGVRPSARSLLRACQGKHRTVTRLLLERGCDPYDDRVVAAPWAWAWLLTVVPNLQAPPDDHSFRAWVARAVWCDEPEAVLRLIEECDVLDLATYAARLAVILERRAVFDRVLAKTSAAALEVGAHLRRFARDDWSRSFRWDLDCPKHDGLVARWVRRGKHTELSKAIANGARISADAVQLAAEQGDARAIELLVSAGAAVEFAWQLFDETPLYAAAIRGHLEAVEVLLRSGADPVREIADGDTPVRAVWFGSWRSESDRARAKTLVLAQGASTDTIKHLVARIPGRCRTTLTIGQLPSPHPMRWCATGQPLCDAWVADLDAARGTLRAASRQYLDYDETLVVNREPGILELIGARRQLLGDDQP